MKTIDVLEHFTELDRSVLKYHDNYVEYFDHLRKVFSSLITSFKERSSDDPREVDIIKQFIQRFLNTIEAFRMKYVFDEEDAMRIDLTDSSFPNHLEFRKLLHDLENRDNLLANMPSEENLKQNVLDHLFHNRKKPSKLLGQLGKRTYLEQLKEEELFLPFTPGELIFISRNDKEQTRRNLYSWGSYDTVTNRPFIYVMIFDQDMSEPALHSDKAKATELVNEIQKIKRDSSPLRLLASQIDEAFPTLHPKILKRIDIGPLHGRYSKDDTALSRIAKTYFTDEDFIFVFTTEIVFSVGSKKSGGLFKSGDIREIFFVDESNKDCMERNVSAVHKYMLAPHSVVQHLRDYQKDIVEKLAIPPIIVT